MDINSIKRDAAAAAEGQWGSDIPGFGDARLKVRGQSAPKVIALLSRMQRAAPKADRNRDGSLKPEANIRIMGEVMHQVVLLDWDGLTDAGKALKYDAKLAKEWLTNPDFSAFADAVAWASAVVDRGDSDKAEDIAKN